MMDVDQSSKKQSNISDSLKMDKERFMVINIVKNFKEKILLLGKGSC
jgi:hypothetical protein